MLRYRWTLSRNDLERADIHPCIRIRVCACTYVRGFAHGEPCTSTHLKVTWRLTSRRCSISFTTIDFISETSTFRLDETFESTDYARRHIDLSGRPCTPVPPTDHRLPMTCADNAPLTFRSQTKIRRVSPRPPMLLLVSSRSFVRPLRRRRPCFLLLRRSRDTRDVYVRIFLTCWANVTRGRYRLSSAYLPNANIARGTQDRGHK